MSDLAARLRNDDGDIGADMLAAAAELERLADVEAERDRLREALTNQTDKAHLLRNALLLIKDRVDRALASAGPPQEAEMCPYCGAGGKYWDGTRCYYAPHPGTDIEELPDPPPERRCTTIFRSDIMEHDCDDPACPVHGTAQDPALDL